MALSLWDSLHQPSGLCETSPGRGDRNSRQQSDLHSLSRGRREGGRGGRERGEGGREGREGKGGGGREEEGGREYICHLCHHIYTHKALSLWR